MPLTDLIPSPLSEPLNVDWDAVESAAGLRFPSDYKEIVEAYGPGLYSDFILLFQPSTENPHLSILDQGSRALDALRYLQEHGEDLPFRVQPPAELVACGRTVNGDMLYWHIGAPDLATNPESWTIVGNEARGPDWFRFDGGLDLFLTEALSGRFELPFLWDEGDLEPTFTPFD